MGSKRKQILQRFQRIEPGKRTASFELYVSALISYGKSMSEERQKECILYAIQLQWKPHLGCDAYECVEYGIQVLLNRTIIRFQMVFKMAERKGISLLLDYVVGLMNTIVRESILVELLSYALVRYATELQDGDYGRLKQMVSYLLINSWSGIKLTEEVVVRSAIYMSRSSKCMRWPIMKALFVTLAIGSKMTIDNGISIVEWGQMYERVTLQSRNRKDYMKWELEWCSEGLDWRLHVCEQMYQEARDDLMRLIQV